MKNKTYLDNNGNALPYPWLINTALCLVGGSQRLRLNYWSRHPKQAAAQTLRDILAISRDTVYGKEHRFTEDKLIERGIKMPSLNIFVKIVD